MNWNTFELEIKNLSKKIDFTPDYIVWIVRWWLIPARLLSEFLKVKSMFYLNVGKKEGERFVFWDVDYDLDWKSILLVEDMLETGKSLIIAKEWLEKRGSEVKTICLYTMPISECKPDFFLKEISEVIKFPWEEI